MNYGAPQVIMIVLLTIGFVSALYNDGKSQKINWIATTVSIIIQVALLKWGGFF